MIDQNGVYTKLTFSQAQEKAIAFANANGITIKSGSVEEQLQNFMAGVMMYRDEEIFASVQSQYYPTGTEIDLQNQGTPRLQKRVAKGYLKMTNASGSDKLVTINSIFTAPNGNTYSTLNNTVLVPNGGTKEITVSSVGEGIKYNLPANQSFTNAYSLTATNPLPIEYGRDDETDTDYLNRIVYDKTNYSSQKATPAAEKELKLIYDDAKIYVNNQNNATALPLVIPALGYIAIVKFASGTAATALEYTEALEILSNRFEFGHPYTTSTALHPQFSGVIYVGSFPENYFVTPAQAVKSTIVLTVSVKYLPNIDSNEKKNLANSFATFFAQTIVNYFGGSSGNFASKFTPNGGSLVTTNIALNPSNGLYRSIAPAFSIEQIRTLVSDQANLSTLFGLLYQSCDVLTFEVDPNIAGQTSKILNIAGPRTKIDFARESLFTDNTSWYDRYIYIDPSLITVNVNEVL